MKTKHRIRSWELDEGPQVHKIKSEDQDETNLAKQISKAAEILHEQKGFKQVNDLIQTEKANMRNRKASETNNGNNKGKGLGKEFFDHILKSDRDDTKTQVRKPSKKKENFYDLFLDKESKTLQPSFKQTTRKYHENL